MTIHNEPPKAIVPGFEVDIPVWGIRSDDELRKYYAAYFEAMGPWLREGIKLFDFGCGTGRFVNYLAERIYAFHYWGIEQDNDFGRYSINYGLSVFGHDPRVRLGVAGDDTDKQAHEYADVVILSSVFTHLSFAKYREIMRDLSPIMDRGGIIVFSCFLDQFEYYHPAPSVYGPDTSPMVFYTQQMLDEWQSTEPYQLTLATSRFADAEHMIFRAQKKQ